MEFTQLKYEVADRIATITLNRPEKLNAYTRTMQQETIHALDMAEEDDNVRVVIFTGAGRAYCAGADLSEGGKAFDYRARGMVDDPELHRDGGGVLGLRIFEMRKPVIAAINGPAVGIGLTMTLPMDIRLVSEDAKLGFVFCRRGIAPEACSTWFLPRLVGMAQAAEWVYTGRVFTAREALEGGLVSKVLPAAELIPAARALATEIAANTSAVSVALSRQMMLRGMGATHPMEAHRTESKAILAMGQSADAREGVTAFLQKREAKFTMSAMRDMPDFYPWWDEVKF